uniref:Uncharacterized protein n=1 Tax=Cyanistes caeruleus TaxID=156563 RepID=A0A8C0UCC7_CYACU
MGGKRGKNWVKNGEERVKNRGKLGGKLGKKWGKNPGQSCLLSGWGTVTSPGKIRHFWVKTGRFWEGKNREF